MRIIIRYGSSTTQCNLKQNIPEKVKVLTSRSFIDGCLLNVRFIEEDTASSMSPTNVSSFNAVPESKKEFGYEKH